MPARSQGKGPAFYTVRLLVRDFRRSWKFYQEYLGLTPAAGHGAPPYGEFVWNGEPRVALFERARMAKALELPAGRRGGPAVGDSALVLETPDVDAFARRLRQRGVPLLRGPTDRPEWQLRTIHLRDPDGYLVEVNSRNRGTGPRAHRPARSTRPVHGEPRSGGS